MKLLIACDRNYAIGYQGDMLFRISDDLRRFKTMTVGNIVVMGRKTLASLPGGRPLPKRLNIVMTHHDLPAQEGLLRVKDEEDLLAQLAQINPEGDRDVYVIGGGVTVASLLPRIDEAHITMLDRTYPRADAWIPNLRTDSRFRLVEESDPIPFEDTTYTFQTYKRIG
jgi:dihydrofolate reductase